MTAPNAQTDPTISDEVVRWIETVSGGSVIDVERRLGGVSREAWFVDVRSDDGDVRPLFLRRDRPASPLLASAYTSFREAEIYDALAATDVPVPPVVALNRDLGTVLMGRVHGEAHFSSVAGTDEGERIAADFMAVLARLHHLSLADVPVAGSFEEPGDDIRAELEVWEEIERRSVRTPDPLRAFGARWIRARVPEDVRPTVLVHGDAGPGNFAFEGDRVVAVFDWELAHAGDPMEDLAWVAIRSVLQPFGSFARRIADYERGGGHRISIDRIRYHFATAAWRDVIALQAQLDSEHTEIELGWCLAYKNTFGRLLLDEIGRREALDDGVPFRPPADASAGQLHRYIGDQLHSLAVESTDPYLRHRARAAQRLVAHLDLVDRYGELLAEAEQKDLAVLLGGDFTTVTEGRVALTERLLVSTEVVDPHVYQYLRRTNDREAFLLAPLIGRLHTATFPDLTS